MFTSLQLVTLSVFIIGFSPIHAGATKDIECYSSSDGSDYRGTVNSTKTGRACQRWDSAYQDHVDNTSSAQRDKDFTAFPELYEDENFCRNPDGAKMPWCYTMEGDWEYCDVQKCEQAEKSKICFMRGRGIDYQDNMSVTETGKQCMEWNSTTPHDHPFTFLEENYCRNPDSSPRPWCYVDHALTIFEYCDIKQCEITDSTCYFPDKANMYSGRVNITLTGYPCQRWDTQTPHRHSFTDLARYENYCRTPDGADVPWCYSTNPSKRWEKCKIAPCDETTRYGCSGNWDSFGNNCYKVVKMMTTQKTAHTECQKLGSNLVELENTEEQHYLFQFLSEDLCFNTYNEIKCTNWAAAGECFENPMFMMIRCRQSCDHEVFCNVDCASDSHDDKAACERWSRSGECGKNPRWMLNHCAQSCDVCSSVTSRAFWLGMKHMEGLQSHGLTIPSHNSTVDGDCMSLSMKDGGLLWTQCDVPLPGYVCKKPKSYIAAGTAQFCDIEFNSTCYRIHLSPKTYTDASLACGSGQLARITSLDVRIHISQRLHTKYLYYWVNTSDTEFTTTQFATNGSETLCGAIQKPRRAYGHKILAELNCSEHHPYICADKIITPPPPPTTKTTTTSLELDSSSAPVTQTSGNPVIMTTIASSSENSSEICGKGWVRLNNYCYKKLFHPWPWSRGRSHCAAIFSDLASVHSKEENSFILKQFPIKTFLWIGLRYYESAERWADSSTLNFSNFGLKHPEWNNTVNCVAMSQDGTWTVKSCSSWFPVLCRKAVKVSCGDLPRVDNAVVNAGDSKAGSYRKYSCKPGYTAGKGSTTIKCKEDLQWSFPLFKCYKNCYTKGEPYYGNYNFSESGKPCQRWDAQVPHEHGYASWPNALENYCRSYEHTQPWCYTVSGESRWENCNVPVCQNETKNEEENGTLEATPKPSLQRESQKSHPVQRETSNTMSLFFVIGLACVMLAVGVILAVVIVILIKLRKSASYSNGEVQFENAIYMQNSSENAVNGRYVKEDGEGLYKF